MDLRVDANEAWPRPRLPQRIRELEPFGITAVEQPVPHADVAALAEVRRQMRSRRSCSTNRCAAWSTPSVPSARGRATCSTCGCRSAAASFPALRLAQFARQHGLGYQLGCQVGETAILSAAGRHFAASVAGLRYLEGSYDRHLVREALGNAGHHLRLGRLGAGAAGAGPGRRHRPRRAGARDGAQGGAAWRKPAWSAASTSSTFAASDGYPLALPALWPAGEPRATVVCIHGIQSHGGWYEYSCQQLCAGGLPRVLSRPARLRPERTGPGRRTAFRRLLDDIAEFLRSPVWRSAARRIPRAMRPFLLAAISWGGKLAVALQRWQPGLVDGLVLLCPGFFSAGRPPFAERLAILGARLVSPDRLFPIPLNDPELFTATPRWQQFIRDDPLALHQATARFLVESVRLDGYLRFVPRSRHVPVLLLLAGQDRIIRNDKTHRFFHQFATADKNVIEYAEAHHTLEFEPDPDRFIAEMLQLAGSAFPA